MKYKTYTFSMASKHDKIINMITAYEGMQGKKMNRSAVVQDAIEEYAKSYLPAEWYERMLEQIAQLPSDEEEVTKE